MTDNFLKQHPFVHGLLWFTIIVGYYLGICNIVFQYRNPMANNASILREPMSVLKMEKLPKYQPR